jgi:hypothetical protein
MIKNPTAGDIVRIRSQLGTGLVCLFDTSRPRFVQGILVHTTPEMATDMDVILARTSTDPVEIPEFLQRELGMPAVVRPSRPNNVGTVTPYPLVLCCDLYGQFLRTQVDRHIAHVDLPALHPLFDPQEVATALGGYRGLPIFRGTPRWDEKIRLLEEELRPLTYPFWEGFRW